MRMLNSKSFPQDRRQASSVSWKLVENFGLEQLHEPHVKSLEGKLWELRVNEMERVARGLYVIVTRRRVVILYVFVKKSQKTPKSALDLARQRMKQIKP